MGGTSPRFARAPRIPAVLLTLLLATAVFATAYYPVALVAGTAADVPLILNEVHADPADGAAGDANGDGLRSSWQDEFIELINTSAAPFDLSGWTLADSTAVRYTFPAGTVLAAGQALVVFGGGTPSGDFAGALVRALSNDRLDLDNYFDTLTFTAPDGRTLTFSYDASQAEDQSLTRSPDLTGAWQPHLQASAVAARYSPGTTVDGRAFTAPPLNEPPQVVAVAPPDDGTHVPLTAGLTITFSEAVTVAPGWIALTCSASGAHSFPAVSAPADTFTLAPQPPLAHGETCQAELESAQIADLGDPPLAMSAGYTWHFATQAPPDEAPTLLATEPISGATAVPLTATLILTFSEPVQAPSVAFELDCPPQEDVALAVSGGPRVFRLTPQDRLAHGRTCRLAVHGEHISDLDVADPPDHLPNDVLLAFSTNPATNILINEIDALTMAGQSNFIELYDGGAGQTALGGLTLVLYEGFNNRIYAVYDLDDFQTDATGYFLAGTRFTPVGDDLTLDDWLPYSGPGAVALYAAPASRFALGGGVDTRDLVDAVVYNTTSSEPAGLLPLLLVGQTAVHENEHQWAEAESSQRCPNGSGGARQTGTFAAAKATPRLPNTCVKDDAPAVLATTPSDGARHVTRDTTLSMTFSEEVTLSGTWAQMTCTRSEPRSFAGPLSGTTISLPLGTLLSYGETCTVNLDPEQIRDSDAFDPPDHPEPFSWTFSVQAADFVLINEVDADTPGVDTAEFVELYDGGKGGTPLDGLTVVLYNGSDDTSYRALDLGGYKTDAAGYFVLGSTAVGALLTLPAGTLQNGPDAVALYAAPLKDFPAGMAVTTADLLDALVYNTDGATDAGLQPLLGVGQAQVNENGRGARELHANQRCPDGAGGARVTAAYLQNQPTPGAANNCDIDEAPQVTNVTPTAGSTAEAPEVTLTVQFSEAVALAEGAVSLRCSNSGPHTTLFSGGPSRFSMTPVPALVQGETCTVRIAATHVRDVDSNDPPDALDADYEWSFATSAPAPPQGVLINEVDADTPGLDTAEFVELYDGGRGRIALDGLVLVFYSGSDDASYRVVSLEGQRTDAAGYFVAGNAAVAGVELTLPPGSLQNGPDAVALYAGAAQDFPAGTAVTTANLIDALVYNTDGTADSGLQPLLLAGQAQVNENGRGFKDVHASQRCPNGAGGLRKTAAYLPNNPTPAAANECRVDEAPRVQSVTPAAGATAVPVAAKLSVEFSEPIVLAEDSFILQCQKSGAHAVGLRLIGQTVELLPDGSLQHGESCSVRVRSAGVRDTDLLDPPDNMAEDYVWTFSTEAAPVADHVLINEVDADTPGLDRAEFVELYDGGGGQTALDGLVLAFYDGASDSIYRLVALDGLRTNSAGYVLIGGPEVAGAAVSLPTGAIQNGPDAVALYAAVPGTLRTGMGVTLTGLLDAVVYHTDDAPAQGLMPLLLPGGTAVDEAALRPADYDANQRCPYDPAGGRKGEFVQNPPTPGASNNCVVDSLPRVQSVGPIEGAVVAPQTMLEITFSEPVATKVGWISARCGEETKVPLTVSGGPQQFHAGPESGLWPARAACTAVIHHAAVTDLDGYADPLAEDFSWQFSISGFPFASCGAPATPIHALPLTAEGAAGVQVTIEAVVTGAFQGREALGGFFLQEEPGDAAADPVSKKGLFVPDGSHVPQVKVGQTVRLQGTAVLQGGLARLTDVTQATLCSLTYVVQPMTMHLPLAADHSYAGLLVTFDQPLTVIDNADLGSHGRLLLAPEWQPYPTSLLPPGAAAPALAAEQEVSRVLLDDGRQTLYPAPLPPYLNAEDTARAGSVVTQVTGVLSPTLVGGYVLQPVQPPSLDYRAARDLPPVVTPGDMRLALIDAGGYFDPGGDEPAGATVRQRDKLLSVLSALDASIIGLTGLGADPGVAAELVDGLNDAIVPPASFAAVYPGQQAGQAASTAILYRADRVVPGGPLQLLPLPAFAQSTPPLLQTFDAAAGGEALAVLVVELAPRDDCPAAGPDADQGDGQECRSRQRLAQAQALAEWAAETYTDVEGPALLMLGDWQAYAQEEPVRALAAGPLLSLNTLHLPQGNYDTLRYGRAGSTAYAWANTALAQRVTQMAQWHHNAAEPAALDYHLANQAALYQPGPYRAATRDTLWLDLGTGVPQPAFTSNAPVPVGRVVQFRNSTPGQRALQFEWDFGDGSPPVAVANPRHVYAAVGTYVVTLRATTLWGVCAESSTAVRVDEARQIMPVVLRSH